MKKEEAIEYIIKGIPYPEQINNLEIEEDAIRFTWRGDRFRVSLGSIMVEQVDGKFLSGSNLAILLEKCIKQAFVNTIP